mgnify:CR=1 FL=1
MEGLYVDIRSLLDETTQERYHERIGGEYMGKSGVINQDFKGEDNTASENTFTGMGKSFTLYIWENHTE